DPGLRNLIRCRLVEDVRLGGAVQGDVGDPVALLVIDGQNQSPSSWGAQTLSAAQPRGTVVAGPCRARPEPGQQGDCCRPPRHASSVHAGRPRSGMRGSTARSIEMGEHIERWAQSVTQTQWEDAPAPVQQHTKLVLLDTLGVILAGGERPEMRQLRERLA